MVALLRQLTLFCDLSQHSTEVVTEAPLHPKGKTVSENWANNKNHISN